MSGTEGDLSVLLVPTDGGGVDAPEPPPKVSRTFARLKEANQETKASTDTIGSVESALPPEPPPKVPRMPFIGAVSARFQKFFPGKVWTPSDPTLKPPPPPKIAKTAFKSKTYGPKPTPPPLVDSLDTTNSLPPPASVNVASQVPSPRLSSADKESYQRSVVLSVVETTPKVISSNAVLNENSKKRLEEEKLRNEKKQDNKMKFAFVAFGIVAVSLALGLGLGLGLSSNKAEQVFITNAPTASPDFPFDFFLEGDFIGTANGTEEFGLVAGEEFVIRDPDGSDLKFALTCTNGQPVTCITLIFASGYSSTVGSCAACENPSLVRIVTPNLALDNAVIAASGVSLTTEGQLNTIAIAFSGGQPLEFGSNFGTDETKLFLVDNVGPTDGVIDFVGLFGHKGEFVNSVGFIFNNKTTT